MVESQNTNILNENLFSTLTVSSVMNKNAKEFGKKNLYDGKDETCWQSA